LSEQPNPAPTPSPRPVATLPSALERFDALRRRLAGRTPALFLDYDGTLTPIVARPELAILSDAARATVARVARTLPTAVISGRDRADVTALVGIDGLVYAGSHGFDIFVPGRGELHLAGSADFAAPLDVLEAELRTRVGDIPGALIERKRYSIAAHYRQVTTADYPRFRDGLDQALAAVQDIREKPGKKVFDFQPAIDWDKGRCVLALLETLGLGDAGYLPIFFGDDVTDEDAFRALHGRGLGVVVAGADEARESAADFRVDDPDAVLALLARLAAAP